MPKTTPIRPKKPRIPKITRLVACPTTRRGRYRYPIPDMLAGDSFCVPVVDRPAHAIAASIRGCIKNHADKLWIPRNAPREFVVKILTERRGKVVRCWRIK